MSERFLATAKCIETRRREGFVYRRYNTGDITYEVPRSVVAGLGMRKFKDAINTVLRGVARKEKAREVRAAVRSRAGWKATAVAHELGITEARVRQIRKEKQ